MLLNRHRLLRLIELAELERRVLGPERMLREEDVALLVKAAYDDATLTFTRSGAGTPVLTANAGDELAGGLANFPVTRSVFVMNNGDAWAFVGV